MDEFCRAHQAYILVLLAKRRKKAAITVSAKGHNTLQPVNKIMTVTQ